MTERVDSPMKDREKAVMLLREHGIAVTPQRVAVGEVLFARHQHMSAEAVMQALAKNAMRVSKATVYNTLNLFAEKGLVREISLDSTRVFYDSNVSSHHHFFNVDTGELTDIENQGVALQELPPLPEGTAVETVDVVIRIRNT